MSTPGFHLDERDNSPGTWLLASISALFIVVLILWSVADAQQAPDMPVTPVTASSSAPVLPSLVPSANAGEQSEPATVH